MPQGDLNFLGGPSDQGAPRFTGGDMPLQRPCIDCGRVTKAGHSRCSVCNRTVRRVWDQRPEARRRQRLQGQGAARRLRQRINREGSATCSRCLRHFLASVIQVDHVLPLFLGGQDVDENIAPLCTPCHRAKSALEAEKRRMKA